MSLRIAAALGLAAILVVVPARAGEVTAQDRVLAESLFREAKALLDQGKVAEACEKLAASQRLEPKPGTALNLAVCHEKLGKTATAWADYMDAASLAASAGQKDREDFARGRVAALESQLSRIVIRVEETPGVEVRLDGRPFLKAAWGMATPVDPGEHVIEASAPGYAPFTRRVSVEPGPSTQEIPVPKLSPPSAEAPPAKPADQPAPATKPAPPPSKSPQPSPPPDVPSRAGSGQAIAAYIAGGVGLVGIGVGTYFGLRTFSKRDEGNTHCMGVYCTAEGLALHADAQRSATISTIGFGVGIAGIGAGVALWLTAGKAAPRRSGRAWVAPVVGPGQAGLSAGGAFF
jgi:hypothetical protein